MIDPTPSEVWLAPDLATSERRTRLAVSADAHPPGSRRGGGAMRTAAGVLALLGWAALCAYMITSDADYDREHPTSNDEGAP